MSLNFSKVAALPGHTMENKMKHTSIKWTPLHKEMVYSQAFQSLKLSERKVLDFAMLERRMEKVAVRKQKKKRYEASNEILIPYRQLNDEPFNMANFTITRAIDRLLSLGFISIAEQGGSKQGHATKYKFIDKWKTWKDGDKPIETRKTYPKRGFTNSVRTPVGANTAHL